jgi:phenylacetate-coenzyme A ligase PaaK-like adenylate-forming protein
LPLSKEIHNLIFELKSDDDFNLLALKVFNYQLHYNVPYHQYVSALNVKLNDITHYSQIPFLPIEFFKSKQVLTKSLTNNAICFSSSGTTGQITSKHYVNDILLYEASFTKCFQQFYGNIDDYCVLALLPNYLERTESSLVYMFNKLIKDSNHKLSGFYLNNLQDLVQTIKLLKQANQKTLLLGVTYALLDLGEMNVELTDNFIVMETGGMKGRRKELIKYELHDILKSKFKVSSIHSEYGMTELLSQAYSTKDGIFRCPPWMKILVRDVNDPFSFLKNKKTGGLNIIDLANINSCSFIETKDLGRINENFDFEILGRFNESEVRGCNLMAI